MTTARATLCATGSALFLRRQRLTNQQRLDMPLPQHEAIAFIKDARVPFDFRIIAACRLMDIASELKGDQGTKLWLEIGYLLQDHFGLSELPSRLLERYGMKSPYSSIRGYIRKEVAQRSKKTYQQQAAA